MDEIVVVRNSRAKPLVAANKSNHGDNCMRTRSQKIIAIVSVSCLAIAGCQDRHADQSQAMFTSPIRADFITSGWSLSVDGAATRYLHRPNDVDTAWVTVRDASGTERFDQPSSNFSNCTITSYYCSPVQVFHTGGNRTGILVYGGSSGAQGTLVARLSDGFTTVTSSNSVVYREQFISTMSFSPSDPNVVLDATQQFSTAAFDSWSNNVSTIFPATFTSSNTAVGIVNSAGLFTALRCGTTVITAQRYDGFAYVSRQSTVTVSPCRLAVTMSGAVEIGGGAIHCTFSGTITGGQPPYTTKHWYSDDTSLGEGDAVTIPVSWIRGANYIDWWVHDSSGQNAYVHRTVTDNSGAALDPNCTAY